MSMHLYFSNDMLRLYEKFFAAYDAAWTDPLQSPPLILSDRHVAKWIKIKLAESYGVVAGPQAMFPEEYLFALLAESLPLSEKPHLLSTKQLSFALLELLSNRDALVADPLLAPLAAYVYGNDSEENVKKKLQIAARLSGLFIGYENSRPSSIDRMRPGLADTWPDRLFFSIDAAPGSESSLLVESEHWQKAVYRHVFGRHGMLERSTRRAGAHYLTLSQLWHRYTTNLHTAVKNAACFLFCVDNVALLHKQIISTLAEAMDFYVYAVNPCSEFWEDIASPLQRGRRAQNWSSLPVQVRHKLHAGDPAPAGQHAVRYDTTENRLLALWGRGIRDDIRMWCQAAHYNFEYVHAHRNPEANTFLSTIQHCLLHRLPELDISDRLPQDTTLRILACPTPLREIEAVYTELQRILRDMPDCELHEIRILVSDPERYRAAVKQVFESYPAEDPRTIPCCITERTAAESLYAKAVVNLISLCRDGFSRSAVLDFFRNEYVKQANGIDDSQHSTWEQWCDVLHIYHGYDRNDRSAHEFDPVEQHTWVHGIKRMLAGRITTSPVAADTREDGEICVPYAAMSLDDDDSLERFIDLVESLYHDLHYFASHTWPDWGAITARFSALIHAWIAAAHNDKTESLFRRKLIDGITQLAQRDSFRTAGPVTATELFDSIGALISELRIHSGNYPTDGVTIAPLTSAPPLPARVTFAVGLNAGAFPRPDAQPTLDLRTAAPGPGDVNLHMLDRLTFLNVLMSTRDNLVISFQAHDPIKDEVKLPSSVILELEQFVNQCILPQGTRLGYETVSLLSTRHLPCARKRLAAQAANEASEAQLTATTLTRICAYLNNPIEHTLRYHFHIADFDIEDTTIDEEEPFTGVFASNHHLQQEWLQLLTSNIIKERREWRQAGFRRAQFDQLYRTYAHTGSTPEGPYAEIDRARLFDSLEAFAGVLCTHVTDTTHCDSLISPSIGPLSRLSTVPPEWIWPAASIEVGGAPLSLTGQCDYLLRPAPADEPVELLFITPYKLNHSRFLPSLLFACLALCTDEARKYVARRDIRIVGIGKDAYNSKVITQQRLLATGDRDPDALRRRLQRYFAQIITAMQRIDYDHIPFAAIDAVWSKDPDTRLDKHTLNEWLASDSTALFPAYRLPEALTILEPDIPDDVAEKIDVRHRPLFTGFADNCR
ncbi:MAG: hypothetical protein GF398_17010 [Chitinivibrionales bacterium]|nr:hypothetical protein [Chitinivibrionales bacterium]